MLIQLADRKIKCLLRGILVIKMFNFKIQTSYWHCALTQKKSESYSRTLAGNCHWQLPHPKVVSYTTLPVFASCDPRRLDTGTVDERSRIGDEH